MAMMSMRWIDFGAAPLTPAKGGAATDASVCDSVRSGVERVRALRRATRCATLSWWSRAARRPQPVVGLRLGAVTRRPQLSAGPGGPALRTEDRKTPRCLLEGLHGTRSTVHSIAFVGAKRAFRAVVAVARAGLDQVVFVLVGRRCDD